MKSLKMFAAPNLLLKSVDLEIELFNIYSFAHILYLPWNFQMNDWLRFLLFVPIYLLPATIGCKSYIGSSLEPNSTVSTHRRKFLFPCKSRCCTNRLGVIRSNLFGSHNASLWMPCLHRDVHSIDVLLGQQRRIIRNVHGNSIYQIVNDKLHTCLERVSFVIETVSNAEKLSLQWSFLSIPIKALFIKYLEQKTE